MSVLWVLLVVLTSVHDCKAANEHLGQKDASEQEECSFEICGPRRRPTPIVVDQQDNYEPEVVGDQIIPAGDFFQEEMIKTNFTCDHKPYIPGFYADMEAKCQIFHLCTKTFVDHFVCPNGTGFDQKYLVCTPDGVKYCGLTTGGYIMNLRVPDTFPIISGVKGYDLNWNRAKIHLKQLRKYQNLNPEMLERDLIRILLLLQFVEVSHVIPDVLQVETSDGTEAAVHTFPLYSHLLDDLLFQIFPLIPLNYSLDPQLPLDQQDSTKTLATGSEPKRSARSLEALWSFYKDAEKASGTTASGDASLKFQEILGPLSDPGLRALKIMKTIFSVIANVSSKISAFSRNNIVSNYMTYLNKFSNYSRINNSAM